VPNFQAVTAIFNADGAPLVPGKPPLFNLWQNAPLCLWKEFAVNPNTPVIIGVGQILQRTSDPAESREPIDLMVDAVRKAADDAGNPALLQSVESVRVVRGIWRYRQPAGYVAEQIGSPAAEKVGTCFGGNMVQSTLNASALDILAGDKSLIVVTGAEWGNTQAKARKMNYELPKKETDGAYDRMIGKDEHMSGEAELARDIQQPIQVYPMFENALRYAAGESIEEHQKRVSELWSRFSAVAATNPNAWLRDPVTAEEIRTPGDRNRMVSFPYPKLMNSNNSVDMSAGIILCSVEKAKALGIDEAKWVYPLSGTDAHDVYYVSERENLHSSPAIRIAGNRALELAGLSVANLDFVDVYSCFPSAVQVAANELGLSHEQQLTVTGGLTFGGGPMNNYVMHSISRMVELLRENRGKKGLITANGGFLTKHAFGVYSTEAPEKDFRHQNVQEEVDQCPTREWLVDFNGEVTIETYTVMFGAAGPVVAHAACLTEDGKRTWANTDDPEVMSAMTREEFCGRAAVIDGAGKLTLP
jgi:acetyl-CoA C-acetyltransferase